MLIEVKVKVAWIIDSKIKKRVETYIMDTEVFAQAEYTIMTNLTRDKDAGIIDSFDIVSLKASSIREICSQYEGENSYIATLRDIIIQDDDTEKTIRYKVLLWANNISDAMSHTREITSQGYNMSIDGLKEVNYTYIEHEVSSTSEN